MMFGHYEFYFRKPDNSDEEGFNHFIIYSMDSILKDCVYETVIKKVYTNNYKFYM